MYAHNQPQRDLDISLWHRRARNFFSVGKVSQTGNNRSLHFPFYCAVYFLSFLLTVAGFALKNEDWEAFFTEDSGLAKKSSANKSLRSKAHKKRQEKVPPAPEPQFSLVNSRCVKENERKWEGSNKSKKRACLTQTKVIKSARFIFPWDLAILFLEAECEGWKCLLTKVTMAA